MSKSNISQEVKRNRIPNLDVDMVYYADDTILFSQSNRGLNQLLSLTERISQQYGLKLNRSKCLAVPMNNDGNIHFYDGTVLTKSYEATYLGNEINRDVNIAHEILNKMQCQMQEVRCTWLKLNAYWKATRATKRWKIIVYDAIIRSKLLYGLETIHLTPALAKKLDAFQYRGLRKIMGMSSTYINRANTNQRLLAAASDAAFPNPGDTRKVLPFSRYHEERRAKLLGHILRSPDVDPLRQVSFTPSTASRIDYGKKRVGRPRQNWVMFSKKYVYENKLHLPNYTETAEQDQRVYDAALRRQF